MLLAFSEDYYINNKAAVLVLLLFYIILYNIYVLIFLSYIPSWASHITNPYDISSIFQAHHRVHFRFLGVGFFRRDIDLKQLNTPIH